MKSNFKSHSFKRFVTFGLGLGIFMSAASGFAQTIVPGSTLSVQANTLNANNGPLVLKGEKADGSTTKFVTLDGNGFLTSTGGATFAESITTNQNLGANGNGTFGGQVDVNGRVKSGGLLINGATPGVRAAFIDPTSVAFGVKTSINSTLTVSETSTLNGINNNNKGITNAGKISGVTAGVAGTDAVNVNQLNTLDTKINTETTRATTAEGVLGTRITNETTRATTAEGVLGTRITNETTRAVAKEKALDTRVDQEIVDRIAGDKRTLEQAQDYADAGDARTLKQANQYTDKEVKAERNRAIAAESDLDKKSSQVGAMALAAAAAAGATPVGDKKTAISAAVGSYDGQTAIAIGVTRMVNPTTKLFFTASKVLNSNKAGVAGGASFSF